MITGQKNTKGRESGDKGLKCTGGGKTGYGRREIVTPCPPPEKWIHIFSVSIAIIPTRLLCKMQANSSGAEFLSAISKFIKSKKILSLLVYVLHKTWNYRHFHVVVVQWRQRNEQKKRDARAKLLFCLVKLLLFLLSRRRCIFNFPLFTIHVIHQKQNFLSAKWIAPADRIRNVFRLIGSNPSFLIGKAWWTNRATVAR